MERMDTLAEKVFSLLKGNGLKIKIFDVDGNEVTDPSMGRRFFITNPNLMVTVNEDDNCIEFNKGANVDNDIVADLQKNIRKLADEFLMNSNIKVFGKSIQPRDYAYQAKMQKEPTMNENAMKPVNHQLLGQTLHRIKYFKQASASTLADDIGVHISEIQPVLNRLVTDGKIAAEPDSHGDIMYSVAVEEAVLETTGVTDYNPKSQGGTRSALLAKYKASKSSEDATSARKAGATQDEIKAAKTSLPSKAPAPVQKKKLTPFESIDAITEVSNKLLTKYKTAAAADAGKADIEGDYKRGDKRFAGIVKATKKQFAKDTEGHYKSRGDVKESFSKMFGSIKTSQQTLENVRILVRHKTPVDENVRGSRTRHISAIFLECNGERFRFPHNYLPGARAMAQHMSHGGTISDKVGSYINESTGQLLKLQSFNRYVTTNKLINEDSSGIIETIKENIQTLRTELKKLTGSKTYETVKARLETFEREALAEDDTSQLKDLFTIRRFDEKFEEVLPIVKQLVQEKDTYHKRIEEAAGNVIRISSEQINTTPIFEFASDYARIGFLLNEFASRIIENDELAGFVNKIGTKLCKEGTVNQFEQAVMTQIFENIKVEESSTSVRKDIKESSDLDAFFDKYTMNFF